MATNRGLRKSDTELKSARQSFVQSLQEKQEFEQECAVIIPELQRLWNEKIIVSFDLPYTEHIEVGTVVSTAVGLTPLLQTQEGVNHINWRHYLYNYDPFMLKKAITRLASRMKLAADGTLENARGPIANIPAYYKALVQDLRIKELNPRKRRGLGRSAVLDSPADPVMVDVECADCFDEYGSRACLRPAHLRAKAELE